MYNHPDTKSTNGITRDSRPSLPYNAIRKLTAITQRDVRRMKRCRRYSVRKATVQHGGRVEVVSSELEVGQTVDVVVLHESTERSRSVIEILNGGPERRLFQTADEVKAYLTEEKASWDR